MFNRFRNIGKRLSTEGTSNESKNNTKVSATPASDKEKARKRLLKVVGIISGILILIFVLVLLLNIIIGRNYTYDQIEQILKNAAIKYYQVQDVLLPSNEKEKSEVDATTLASDDYKLMKPLSKLKKNASCTGKVVVEKINNKYIYTPYLDCGSSYKTEELYKAIKNKNKIVTSGNGLYEMNGEYVFRGDSVNNYVKLSKGLFRIVKITSENKILLIPEFDEYYSDVWDDRYNLEMEYSSGINSYRPSRMRDILANIYSGKSEDFNLLTDTDRQKLTTFSFCIGKRSAEEENNTGSVECADFVENQMIGLLTVFDYINASIDTNCKNTLSKSCQNYNYLKIKDTAWWLSTTPSFDTNDVYYVNEDGYITYSNASTLNIIRPTIMLNNNVMIRSGKGTKDSPFILK